MSTHRFSHKALSVLLLASLSLMTACADLPKDPVARAEYARTNDPLEPMNRTVTDVNDFLDRLLLRPLAELYRATVPPPVRDRVANILGNMKEPVILANNLLQGEFSKAGTTISRFGVNTVLGVGGMFEVANDWNLQQQSGDFGQTLHSWGIKEGPYLVLPLFGPSNFRDAIGMGVDMAMSPWGYLAQSGGTARDVLAVSTTVMDGLTRREQNIEGLDALRSGSLDFYAQMRSVYRQYRAKQLGITTPDDMPKFEDYDM